jgi:hypothetical protein
MADVTDEQVKHIQHLLHLRRIAIRPHIEKGGRSGRGGRRKSAAEVTIDSVIERFKAVGIQFKMPDDLPRLGELVDELLKRETAQKGGL